MASTSTVEINHEKLTPRFGDHENVNKIKETTSSLAYAEFFENFLLTNKPCLFDADVTLDWPCRRNWCNNNAPNFDWFKQCFDDCEVPIADCNKRYYNAQQKNDMPISDYIDYWINYRNSNYSNKMPLLYLKDWHCVKSNSNISIYNVPKYFASDWLNEYYTAHPNLDDDYMFVYMGPKGTWTPFHVDVFTSYSWSANIVGKKRWLLFPPGHENHLKNTSGDLVYDLTSIELDNESNLDHNQNNFSKSFEVIQEAGQVIFIPSGWHHQVWNLEDTISINHNWFNGCNILNVWNSLRKELSAVMKEIDDCKDMDDWGTHCQIMLKASFGINYFQFFELLSYIGEKRLNSVINSVPVKCFEKWDLGKNHCLFDLRQIKIILESFINDTIDKGIYTLLWKEGEIKLLLDKISKIISD